MGVTGGGKVLKYLVFIFNFLFFLIGCGVLGLGIYSKVGESEYRDLSEEISDISKYATAGNLMIAVGVIIVVVAFFGCCGAVTENGCMVLVFFCLLLLIFILELAACIYGYVKRDDLEDELKKDFQNAIQNKYSNTTTESGTNKIIDEFQKKHECCGYTGYTDWRNSKFHMETGQLPKSCCRQKFLDNKTCPTTTKIDVYHTKSCFNEVVEWFKDNMYAIGSAAIAFAIIQVLGLVFSMMLYCQIKKSNDGTIA